MLSADQICQKKSPMHTLVCGVLPRVLSRQPDRLAQCGYMPSRNRACRLVWPRGSRGLTAMPGGRQC